MNKREFIKKACIGASAAIAAPYVIGAKNAPIKWRLQTYAGPALAEHVIKPSIDAFNKAANGEMVIELYCADQLVPTSELFRAMQAGTIDAVQSDDDSIASPADVAVFGGYFPFATRYSLDIPTLFYQFGLDKIWEESYNEIKGVTWLSAGAWCGSYFANTKSWEKVPDHLKTLFKLCMDSSHYYRQYWYWGGEAKLRVQGPKLKLTTIPDEEWKTVEDEAVKFWDEIAKTSPRAAKVVQIFKDYNAMMSKAGRPYRG